MSAYWPAMIDGAIPVLVGMYGAAMAYGIVTPKPDSRTVTKLIPHFKWAGPVLILFGLFLGWQSYVRAGHPPAEQLAEEISSRLSPPVRIDELTQLDAVQGKAEVISMHYTIFEPHKIADSIEDVRSRLQARGYDVACTNPDFTRFLSNGYSIELRYSFLESAEKVSILVTPGSCAR